MNDVYEKKITCMKEFCEKKIGKNLHTFKTFVIKSLLDCLCEFPLNMAPLKPLVNFQFKHFLYNKVMNPMLPLVVTLLLPQIHNLKQSMVNFQSLQI